MAIREIIQQNITQIATQSSRVARVKICSKTQKNHSRILSTYAPRNGRKAEDRRQRLIDVKEILNKTCKRHMIIWRTDANGQLGRDGEEDEGAEKFRAIPRKRNGSWDLHAKSKNRRGNGQHIQKICQKQQKIPMAT